MRQSLLAWCVVGIFAAGRSAGQVVTQAPGESAAMPALVHVTSELQDSSGRIWVGTEGEGVWMLERGKWTQYMKASGGKGLGDEFVYALAMDRKGRLWAGQLNHGVSVFNDETWKTYTNWGPNAGPVGSHVYALAVSPQDGDVWIGTDLGVSRYSEGRETWTHFGRPEGLPADQVRGIAVSKEGDVYLATALDGVLVGRAADNYAKWEQTAGGEEVPLVPHGKGLPGRETNCVTIDAAGHVYVGTPRGLAVSGDAGKSWRFVRGKDWAEKAQRSYDGVPDGWKPSEEGLLSEDWVSCLMVDAEGKLWVGHRTTGYERIDPQTSTVMASLGDAPMLEGGKAAVNDVRGLAVGPDGRVLVGRYLAGLAWRDAAAERVKGLPEAEKKRSGAIQPRAAAAPTVKELQEWEAKLAALPKAGAEADKTEAAGGYIGQDWSTGGDWLGRYGRQFASLGGWNSYALSEVYAASVTIGGHYGMSGPMTYSHSNDSTSRRALYNPTDGKRREIELNDGGYQDEVASLAVEGPDLWVKANIPEGPHRISIYMLNPDGQTSRNALRDFVLELRQDNRVKPDEGKQDRESAQSMTQEDRLALEKLPVVARSRASDFFQGEYEQFLVNRPGLYWVKVVRNNSFVTKLFGVFVDRLGPEAEHDAHAFFWHVENDPPKVNLATPAESDRENAARHLWVAAEASWERPGAAAIVRRAEMAAYRAAEAEWADPDLLALWRWKLGLWGTPDREQFDARMQAGLEKFNAEQGR
jgi:hypothetical protein